MALGKLGSLVTTNPKPVGIFTATNSQTVTVYVNNQNNVNAKYSIGVSTDASTIQDSEYVNKLNPIGPLEVVEVEKLYLDVDQTLVVQSSVSGVSFSAIAVGSGSTEGTGYGRTDTLIVTDSNKGQNLTLFNPSEDVICTIAANNQSYESGKVYVGVADSAGNLNNGWIIFAQRIVPGGNFSIKDLYIGSGQSVVVKSNIADVSFTTLAVNLAGGGAGGGPSSLDATLGVGNTSDLGMSVGVVTATQIRVGTTTFTEDLVVQGNARITGILTIGTASITVDGDNTEIHVGSGVTLSHTGGAEYSGLVTASSLHVHGAILGTFDVNSVGYSTITNLETTNINAAGVVTSTSYVVGGGTSTQFLKADGSLDPTTYLTDATVGGDPDATPNTIVSRNNQAGFSAGIVTASSVHINSAVEGVSVATTYQNGTKDDVILECDISTGTIFTHDIESGGDVGIVSFKGFPVDANTISTYTIIFTQQSTTPNGVGNTTPQTGIGTNVYLEPLGVTGFSTTAKVGSGTTVVLSSTASEVDFVAFAVHYNGAGSGTASNYKVYSSSNGGFAYGSITI